MLQSAGVEQASVEDICEAVTARLADAEQPPRVTVPLKEILPDVKSLTV